MLVGRAFSGKEDDGEGSGDALADADAPWDAPSTVDAETTSAQINATIALPGSKSLTARELILSALAEAEGTLIAPLKARDTTLMREALENLGTTMHDFADERGEHLRITPADELRGSTSIACGLAGTVMRFVPPVAALALGPVAFDGDPYARKRPMGPVLDGLRQLDVDVADEGRSALPFTIHGKGRVAGGKIEIDASLSSQFVSALLLAAPRFDEGIHIVHTGKQLPSQPHIDMTIAALEARGVRVERPAQGEWRVRPGVIRPRDIIIEPDLSNAAPFLAAAVATGGTVSVPLWPSETTQVGAQLPDLLAQFGATSSLADGTLTVQGPETLGGVELAMPEAGELALTMIGLAALAAHRDGQTSTITGIGHTRHHETDRIAAIAAELLALGADLDEHEDGITIRPATLSAPEHRPWRAYADHRMATTGALIGLLVPGMQIDDIASTSKTLPQFVGLWAHLLGRDPVPTATPDDGTPIGALFSGASEWLNLPGT